MAQNVVALDDHRTDAASMPEMNIGTTPLSANGLKEAGSIYEGYLPADTSASDSDADLAMLQIRAGLDGFSRGLGVSDPEVMVGVGVDANVGLEGRLDVRDAVTVDC
jgi:hypothetical protein